MTTNLYIAIVCTLVLVVGLVDLFVDLRTVRPRRRRDLKDRFVDEGIALAERSGAIQRPPTPGDVKLRNAVDWADEQCRHHNVKTTRSELARLVEVRLGLTRKQA